MSHNATDSEVPPLPAPDPIHDARAYHDTQAMCASEEMWGQRRRGVESTRAEEAYERHSRFSNAIRDLTTRAERAEAEGVLLRDCLSLSQATISGMSARIDSAEGEIARLRAENAGLREEAREVIHNAIALFGHRCTDEGQLIWLNQARAALSSEQAAADGGRS